MYFEKKPSYKQREKIALCEAQNWRCCYCQFEVMMLFGETEAQNAATREHLKPRAKGGSDDYKNLVIACQLCNIVRDHADPLRFARTVQKLLQNPTIRAAWHTFTASQIGFLREEIEFAAIKENVEKKGGAGDWNMYAYRVERRKALLGRMNERDTARLATG